MKLLVVETIAAILVAGCISPAQSTQVGSTSAPGAGANPLLLEKNEGEKRLWRPEPGEVDPGGFIGDEIPRHKHLGQDEILLIEKGTAHIHLGDEERDLMREDGVHSGVHLGECEEHRRRAGQLGIPIFSARV